MFQNQRVSQRIPCDGDGFLIFPEERPGMQVVNLSRGGACLMVDLEIWAALEDMSQVAGGMRVSGRDFRFTGRICWSLIEDMKVRFGLEFLEWDKEILEHVIEDLSVVSEEPPDNTFNL